MADETSPDDAARQSLSREAAALLGDIPGLVTDRVRLFSLELKRATEALGQLAALGLLAAILAATAWIALWAGIAAGLIAVGLAWFWVAPAVLVIILVINVGGAAWCASGLRVTRRRPIASDGWPGISARPVVSQRDLPDDVPGARDRGTRVAPYRSFPRVEWQRFG